MSQPEYNMSYTLLLLSTQTPAPLDEVPVTSQRSPDPSLHDMRALYCDEPKLCTVLEAFPRVPKV